MARTPDVPEFQSPEEKLLELPVEMLGCRDLGHNWERGVGLNATLTKGKRVIRAERVVRCVGGCGCVRTDVFERDEWGMLVKTKGPIKYPEGYVLQRDDPEIPIGRVTRNMARSTLMAKIAPGLIW